MPSSPPRFSHVHDRTLPRPTRRLTRRDVLDDATGYRVGRISL